MYISCCAPIRQCQMVAEAGFDRVALSAQEVAGTPPDQLSSWRVSLRPGRWSAGL